MNEPRRRESARFVRKLTRLLARVLYRSVEVVNPDPGWIEQPSIIVANHFAGFADPALLIGILRRRPRFLAKATLWKIPLVGWFLGRLGVVPVYRAEDGATAGNVDTFAECTDALRSGDVIAIFPEGTTHDDPAIKRVKTGAARIALGARAAGVTNLRIVPIGLHFEDKASIRSRVFVRVGEPLDLDGHIAEITGPDGSPTVEDHQTVRRLTAEIERRLRVAAPNFADAHEARSLSLAAEVALRSTSPDPGAPVPLAHRSMAADGMAALDEPVRRGIVAASDTYREELDALGLSDREVVARPRSRSLAMQTVGLLLLTLLLSPFAVAGLVMNVAPYLVVKLVARIRIEPVTMATIKVLVAVAAFGAMWGYWAYLATSVDRWQTGVVVFLLAPVYGAVAVWVWERVQSLVTAWRAYRRRDHARPVASEALTDRRALVHEVVDAIAPTEAGT